MQIVDLLNIEGIALGVKASSKAQVIDIMVELQQKCRNITNKEKFKQGILEREAQSSTSVGMGIAIPHAKNESVKKAGLVAITVPEGVDYHSPGGDKATLLFMIAAPKNGSDVHLEVLSRLMQMLMDEKFANSLRSAKTAHEFLNIIDEKEKEKLAAERSSQSTVKDGLKVVAVTACPTGIAHTYMAAEALSKAGAEMGVNIKVETNGSGGAKNVLTPKEIEEADGVIIAADISINLERFDGKPVLQCRVADGIHKAQELINKIADNEAPIYVHKGAKTKGQKQGGIYGHLMNGVSHMLPFTVAGGLFIAIAFLIDTAMGVNAAQAGGSFGTVTPAANWFKTLGSVAFNLMVPILSGYIAMSIADRPGLLVGLVGGFLATSGATFVNPSAVNAVPSGFLGGLLAGFAGGYIMLLIEKACAKLPQSLEGIKPVLIYPILGLLSILLLMCAVNPFMGYINSAMSQGLNTLAKNPAMMIPLCALLGGMMAIDMGGPFNKAAYTFATLSLANATDSAYMIMAAVMIGGMVPPIAIALSNTFFKSKWTDEEAKNAPVNYIMGLSFITEGAIPYAAAYPLRVIPSCFVGSAIAGALSGMFGCKLLAPHGGVFVFATMQGTWYFYLLALAVGSFAGMIMLAILKGRVKN